MWMGPDGYYDEEGYYHRSPPRAQAPQSRTGPQPIRDPYYDQYKNKQVYYDQYGRPVVVRRRYVTPVTERRRIRARGIGMFTAREVLEIAVATAVLAAAFAMVLGAATGTSILFAPDPVNLFIQALPIAIFATVTSFTAHELAHKFMAQKHGLPAEFVINPMGIVVALATAAIIGFLFALPGAVVFSGAGADDKIVGKVGAAGPATNIVLGLIFFPLMFIFPALWLVVFVNFFLAGFNMIPFGQFDGLKVWRWSSVLYIGMLAIIIVMFLLSWFHLQILGI
jgi:Zn-dependent protease